MMLRIPGGGRRMRMIAVIPIPIMSALGDFIDRLDAVADRVEDPNAFWRSRQNNYLKAARGLVRRVMRAARPATASIELWEERTERMVKQVSALLAQGEGGINIALAADRLGSEAGVRKLIEEAGTQQQVQWLEEWVKAGDDGDPLGKRVDDFDSRELEGSQDYRKLAFRLHRQTEIGTFDLPEDFFTFVGVRLGGGVAGGDNILLAILVAWREEFASRIVRDYLLWLRRRGKK
jgi:hypothetical protein